MASHEMMKSLGEAKGFPELQFDENGMAGFTFSEEGLVMTLETNLENTSINAAVELGVLSGDDFDLVLSGLLAVNGAFYLAGKGIFSIEGDDGDRIVFMKLFDAERIKKEEFLAGMEEFMSDAIEWYGRIRQPELGIADEEDEGETPKGVSGDFIRV